MNQKTWQIFEKQVFDLFRLKGFEPVSNVVQAGRQHDIILYSSEESTQPILVECKYHHPRSKGLVSVTEVNNFAATVLRLRSSGDISAGYLVTNTGFTGNAKGALSGRPEEKFIFIKTVSDLRRSLVNLDRYLHKIVADYESSDIKQIYEPLKVKINSHKKTFDTMDVFIDFIDRGDLPLLVLIGDYGTGKSTVCQRLSYLLALRIHDGSTGRMPIYIPLKWYNQCGSAIALLQRFLDEAGLRHSIVDGLLSMHASGQLVIILDGFDEMLRRSSAITRHETIQDLMELCVPNSKIILTGRPGYFSDTIEMKTPFRGVGITGARDRIRKLISTPVNPKADNWAQFEVSPLMPSQIRSFLLKRLPLKAHFDRLKYVDDIMQIIKTTYNLADLAKRPILLEMIAQTISNTNILDVPNTATLYGQYVNTWLQIDADKGAFRNLITPDDRLSFSIMLAWLFQDQGIQEIHWEELQSIVGRHFGLKEIEDVDHFASDVRTCTFLTRDDKGNYKFAHLSFQEYFCARFLIEREKHLKISIEDILGESDGSVMEIWENSPAILDFAGDLLDCPISPGFWRYVREMIAKLSDTNWYEKLERKLEEENNNTLLFMVDMAEGEASILELWELTLAYRDTYKYLCEIVSRELTVNPDNKELQKLFDAITKKRLPSKYRNIIYDN